MNALRIEQVVTHGSFELDGGSWEVDNNVWLLGTDAEVIVVDPAHELEPIVARLGTRTLRAVVLTHAHNDHIGLAPTLAERFDVPVWLHPDDDVLWKMTHPEQGYTPLTDGQRFSLGDNSFDVLHTPGHTPGSVCLHVPANEAVLSGDTLFAGGPGATGRSFSDFPTIIASIRERLLTLPAATVVHPGHGDDTTIGAEAPHLAEWIERGW